MMDNREMAKVLAEMQGWHVARGSETYPGQGYIEGDYWFDSADNQRWSVDSCGEFQGEDDRVYSPASNIAQAIEALRYWRSDIRSCRRWTIDEQGGISHVALREDNRPISVVIGPEQELPRVITEALVEAVSDG